jgi:hypothetical protein
VCVAATALVSDVCVAIGDGVTAVLAMATTLINDVRVAVIEGVIVVCVTVERT